MNRIRSIKRSAEEIEKRIADFKTNLALRNINDSAKAIIRRALIELNWVLGEET